MNFKHWICSCGNENVGNFCTVCGNQKPNEVQEVLNSDIANEELSNQEITTTEVQNNEIVNEEVANNEYPESGNANSETLDAGAFAILQQEELLRQRFAEENERKSREEQNKKNISEYDTSCKRVISGIYNKFCGSNLILSLAILTSIIPVLHLVSFVIALAQNSFFDIITLVNIAVSSIVCSGFWLVYTSTKNPVGMVNPKGLRLIRGVVIFQNVCLHVGFALLFVGIMLIRTILCANFTTIGDIIGKDAETIAIANIKLKVVFFVIIFVFLIIWVIMALYYRATRIFTSAVKECVEKNTAPKKKYTAVVVLFFILGVFGIISVISNLASASTLKAFEEGLEESLAQDPELSKYSINFSGIGSINVTSIIANIVSSAMYILGAIVAMKFNKLDVSIKDAVAEIPLPIEE